MIEAKLKNMLDHSKFVMRKKKKKNICGILDDFVTKQLPNNVIWLVNMLYALEHKGDRALVSTQDGRRAVRFCDSMDRDDCISQLYRLHLTTQLLEHIFRQYIYGMRMNKTWFCFSTVFYFSNVVELYAYLRFIFLKK